MTLRVALAAEDAAGVQALRMLAEGEHTVVAVFTGSGHGGPGAAVAEFAEKQGIPVRPAAEVRDAALADWLREQGTDLMLNVHSLHVVDSGVLEAPAMGAYNLHPGPLPELAGLNAPSWALYEGAERHGVTLHRMTPGVDQGPIAFSDSFEVGPQDTGLTLLTKCVRRGLPLVAELLAVAAAGDPIPARTQDTSRRRWFDAGPPEGGRLGWDRPARRVVGFVRACDYGPFPSPWGFPRCSVGEREVAIASATAESAAADVAPGTVRHDGGAGALVAASDTWVRVTSVEVDGEKRDAEDILKPAMRLENAEAGNPTPERASTR
jgi:methionyl-tRNA formyltransferase